MAQRKRHPLSDGFVLLPRPNRFRGFIGTSRPNLTRQVQLGIMNWRNGWPINGGSREWKTSPSINTMY